MNVPITSLEAALMAGYAITIAPTQGGYRVVVRPPRGFDLDEIVNLAADAVPLILRWVAKDAETARPPLPPAQPYPIPYFGTKVQRAQRRVQNAAGELKPY